MAEFILKLVDKVTEPAAKMGEALKGVGEHIEKGESALGKFGLGLDKLIGTAAQGRNELGQFTKMSGPLAEGMEAASGPIGMIVTALGAVVIAGAAATVIFAGLALGGMDLALEVNDLHDKMVATFSAMTTMTNGGEATVAMIHDMRGKTGLTTEKLGDMTKKLIAMGFQGKVLQDKLFTLSNVMAIDIPGGAGVYEQVQRKLTMGTKIATRELRALGKTGVDFNAVAKDMGMTGNQLTAALKKGGDASKKFGEALDKAIQKRGAGALEVQIDAVENQLGMLKDNLKQLFVGIDVGPFLKNLHKLVDLFDENSAVGKVLHKTLKWVFDSLFTAAANSIPKVVVMIKLFIANALEAAIYILKSWNKIGPMVKGLGSAIKMFFISALIAVGVVIGVVVIAVTAFVAATYAAMSVGAMFGNLIFKMVNKVKLFAKELNAGRGKQMIKDFIAGLLSGLTSGASTVASAVQDLGKNMLKSLKNVLGIASPSKEMAKLGEFAGIGFAQGLNKTNGAGMGSGIGSATLANASGSTKGGGGKTVLVTISQGAISIIAGMADAGQVRDLLEEQLTLMFERVAMTQGLG